ncbi:MAG: ABC transporter permease [Clostridiales Family XIII bacterium]|jgi:branched-chain amino acid transport system permease protein|nr:ABC transporter permease [Clostridiales Family XIII bacterium]
MNFLSLFLIGLSYGLILFLLAAGLTLTMGLMRVINMSHGAMFMIAGYFGVWAYTQTGSWLFAVVAAGALAAVLGLLLETVFLRRLYDNPANQVLLTIGFINILNNIAQWIWGGFPASVPIPKLFNFSVTIGNIGIPAFRFFVIGFGVVTAVLLWILQDKTRIGAMVRAGMDNREVASALGMNNKMLFTGVFVLGSLIAGVTSMIGGTQTGLNMNTGWNVLLSSIIVVVIGGTGSVQGALLGGIIIGLIDSFGKAYFPNFASLLIYLVLIVVLLIKPSGLLGRKTDVNRAAEVSAGRGGAPKRHVPIWEENALAAPGMGLKIKAYRKGPYLLVVIVLAALPLLIGTYTQSMMTKVLIYALFAMSLDVIMGYTGMRSFGHAAFFGMGGYAVGLLAKNAHIDSFWLIFILTLLLCAALSAVIGYFTLKTSGTYFLMVTMAFGQLLYVVADKWYQLTGGADGLVGIPRPKLGFDVSWSSSKIYYFVLLIFLICYILLHHVMRSSYGRSLLGIRENEGRMRSLGFDTWLLKYKAMIIAGVFAGVAGLLYAYTYGQMVPTLFSLDSSAMPMLMVIMGGGSTLWGPALGALVIILFQNYTGIYMPDRWPLLLGILYVLCVMFLRGGFARHLTRFWNWVGSRIFGRFAPASADGGAGAEEEAES